MFAVISDFSSFKVDTKLHSKVVQILLHIPSPMYQRRFYFKTEWNLDIIIFPAKNLNFLIIS